MTDILETKPQRSNREYSVKENDAAVEQILNPDGTFIDDVEKLVKVERITLLEAILHLCHTKGIEIEEAAAAVKANSKFKARFKEEAQVLHLTKE